MAPIAYKENLSLLKSIYRELRIADKISKVGRQYLCL